MNRVSMLDVFGAALSAVDPYRAVNKALRVENNVLIAAGSEYDLGAVGRVFVVGAGKASETMAPAVGPLPGLGRWVINVGRAAAGNHAG